VKMRASCIICLILVVASSNASIRLPGNWTRWPTKGVWGFQKQNAEATGAARVWCAGYLCVRGGSNGSEEEERRNKQDNSTTHADRKPKKKRRKLTGTGTASTSAVNGTATSTILHKRVRQRVRRGKHKIKERIRRTVAKTTLPSKAVLRQWSIWTNHTSNKARQQFYDSIELVSQALLRSELDAVISNETDHNDGIPSHDLEITHQSDLTLPGRKVFVVTTATLPWFTGTAVNPLLRAAHMCRKLRDINGNATSGKDEGGNETGTNEVDRRHWVTLVVPWLEVKEDRLQLYGENNVFEDQDEQETYIRTWLRDEAGMPDEADPDHGLRILWYPARYHPGLHSVFAMGDLISLIPDEEADVVVLEEPEHLNWYRAPGEGWAKKFSYSVGIVHTNYVSYASSQYHGLWTAPAIALMSSAMIRAYCHKVIKLSGVLQSFAPEKEVVANVHGVRSDFLNEGRRRAVSAQQQAPVDDDTATRTQAYFIGKILWAKGLDKLLELQSFYRQVTGDYFPIDIYGNGPDLKEIKRAYHGRKRVNRASADSRGDEEEDSCSEESGDESSASLSVHCADPATTSSSTKGTLKARSSLESVEFDLPKTTHEFRRRPIPASFPGRVDHAQVKGHKIFINPSVTEVLCTTTAEALAMGKFAIIPYHPSNAWFKQFPNCLMYRNKWEFAANLRWALTHDPEPLTPELAHQFSWEAATDRFITSAAITRHEARERAKAGASKRDERIEWFHNELGKSDALRKLLGGGPVARQVAWQKENTPESVSRNSGDENEDDDTQDDKFIGSSLADAISHTLANLVPLSESQIHVGSAGTKTSSA